jgi:hypothetical protein
VARYLVKWDALGRLAAANDLSDSAQRLFEQIAARELAGDTDW